MAVCSALLASVPCVPCGKVQPRPALLPPGITLSPNQVKRGTQLAADRGLGNVKFQVRPAGRAAQHGMPHAAADSAPALACMPGTLTMVLVQLPYRAAEPCLHDGMLHTPCSLGSKNAPSPPQVMDALKMEFPDNSFDLVWACESGEHMPDKKAYVDEMVRQRGGERVAICWGAKRDKTLHKTLQTLALHGAGMGWAAVAT